MLQPVQNEEAGVIGQADIEDDGMRQILPAMITPSSAVPATMHWKPRFMGEIIENLGEGRIVLHRQKHTFGRRAASPGRHGSARAGAPAAFVTEAAVQRLFRQRPLREMRADRKHGCDFAAADGTRLAQVRTGRDRHRSAASA